MEKTESIRIDSDGKLVIKEPPGGFPDEEFYPMTEAAKDWKVTPANIGYYVRKGVPTKIKRIPTVVKKNIVHVHKPSLEFAKANRVHHGGKEK